MRDEKLIERIRMIFEDNTNLSYKKDVEEYAKFLEETLSTTIMIENNFMDSMKKNH